MLGLKISDGKIAFGGRVPRTHLERILIERNRLCGLTLAGKHNPQVVQSRKGMGINPQSASKLLRSRREISLVHRVRGLLQIRAQLNVCRVRGRRVRWCGLSGSGRWHEQKGGARRSHPEQYWHLHTPDFNARTGERSRPQFLMDSTHMPSHNKPDKPGHPAVSVNAVSHPIRSAKQEFDRHPLNLTPERCYSPATFAKAYFSAMGIKPPREKFKI